MQMIVGLGNPGGKYVATRHNIGFILADAIAEKYGAAWRSKFQAEEQKISIASRDVILLKPQTFMNLSGQSVAAAAKFYKIKPRDILVIHDELDLEPGRVKLKMGGGHAGHNGLRSIIEHIGSEFERLRVGIGHPGNKAQVSNYVLHDFAKSDQEWIVRLQENLPPALPYYYEANKSRFIESLQGGVSAKAEGTKPAPTPMPKAPKASPKDESHSPFDGLKAMFKRGE